MEAGNLRAVCPRRKLSSPPKKTLDVIGEPVRARERAPEGISVGGRPRPGKTDRRGHWLNEFLRFFAKTEGRLVGGALPLAAG